MRSSAEPLRPLLRPLLGPLMQAARRLVRLRLPAIGVAALLLAATACTQVPSAISSLNRPTTVVGARNGDLPASVLYTQGPSCRVYKKAAGSLVGMLAAARRDGVALAPEECYRDYAGQVYWRRWWCARHLCGNAAVPGTSNHGWGKAVDLRGLAGEMAYGSTAYRWMATHAAQWGWQQPVGLKEAWHWEWVGDGGTLGRAPVRPDLFTWAR